MPVHHVRNKYLIFTGSKKSEAKFREELSKELIGRFTKGPFADQNQIKDIILYSLDYYIRKFKEICHSETSLRFYQEILRFHEDATEFVYSFPNQDPSPEVKWKYLAEYRRTLKYILETACEVEMKTDTNYKGFEAKIESKLSDLLFLGNSIHGCVSLYAEQTMIEDVADVYFDANDQYVFTRRHHYNYLFQHFGAELHKKLQKSIVDSNAFPDFVNALKTCFAIDYKDVSHVIASIHEELKDQGENVAGFGWDTLPLNSQRLFGIPLEVANQFFRGLQLNRNSKMDLQDLVCKPHKLNRYIYKPILIWRVNGAEYAFLGKAAWTESFYQYATNAIPWGKAPDEWLSNQCFKDYVHRKEDDHDKWLDDAVEEILKKHTIIYDRNIKQLITSKGRVSIDVAGLGEIDFIILLEGHKKALVVDCKHLLGRYDIVNQRNDYSAFVSGKKSYNSTMQKKLHWLNQNRSFLEQHFQSISKNAELSLTDYSIEGMFIVNSPTFYMYNSEYRIHTVDQVEDLVLGKNVDPEFTILEEQDESSVIMKVKYPYFKKPSYLEFDEHFDESKE